MIIPPSKPIVEATTNQFGDSCYYTYPGLMNPNDGYETPTADGNFVIDMSGFTSGGSFTLATSSGSVEPKPGHCPPNKFFRL